MNGRKILDSCNKVHFTSLGCARNLVDSEVMIALLLRSGYELTPSLEEADFLIVNTCGFLQSAREEALQVFEELFSYKKERAKVIAVGCMVQKCPEILKKEFPNIHALLGSGDMEKIVEVIQKETFSKEITEKKSYLQWGEIPRFLSTPKHYAYLKIAEGCKKRCSYCIIPHIKGKLKSKSVEQILKEVRLLLSQGVFEIILIAQDLGDYGKDFLEKKSFSYLLQKILEEKGDFWIRLLYLYPDEIEEELVSIIASDSRVCRYIDMPIQHINGDLLKKMHRKTSPEDIYQVIEMIRGKIPDMAIRTSLMVGFPSETQAQFEELLSFVKKVRLSQVGVFAYSKEKESYSARLPGHLPQEIKEQRQEQLQAVLWQIAKEENQKKIGMRYPVVIDGVHPDSSYLLQGRNQYQCPEVDGVVILNDFETVPEVSRRYLVEITDYADYDLIGKVVSSIPICKNTPLVVL